MADTAPNPDQVTLTIDGREVSVPRGTTILEAAETLGNRIPHYCYHPGLSAPAQCRLCLVEVEGAPKLAALLRHPSVRTARWCRTESGLAEESAGESWSSTWLNHPLDCPICDQSGECKLQDYVHAEGRKHGRSREPKRVFGRDDFGGTSSSTATGASCAPGASAS
jgi:NADH-quinone oxidoreductase subunit G